MKFILKIKSIKILYKKLENLKNKNILQRVYKIHKNNNFNKNLNHNQCKLLFQKFNKLENFSETQYKHVIIKFKLLLIKIFI